MEKDTNKKKISWHEAFITSYYNYNENPNTETLLELEKTILKTKFLIPVYTEKTCQDRIFNKDSINDFITLQDKKNKLALPLFTTKKELLELGADVYFMIVTYYEAFYLSLKNNLKLIINPFSINYEIPLDLEVKRVDIEGVISPKLEVLLKEYKREQLNNQYIEILKLLKTETLFMPLCIDDLLDYTLSYKEFENGKYLCLYVSQRDMYKSIPKFKAFEKVTLDKIINILEMMDFQGILLPEGVKISIKTLTDI